MSARGGAGRRSGADGRRRDARGNGGRRRPGGAPTELGLDRSFEPVLADLGRPAVQPGDAGRWEVAEGRGRVELGRVVRLDRGYPLVVGEGGAHRAEHQTALVKGGGSPACVGDWVLLRHEPTHDKALIDAVLPRTAELSRWDGRQRGARQVLAANVDLVVIVQPLSERRLDPDRVARSAVLARQGGSRVAVVLTKADRVAGRDPGGDADTVREVLGEQVPVCVTSVVLGRGVEDVRALLAPGTVSLLLGESGAGKSSLVNALLGERVLGTAEVRSRDDAGRHTTVARRMLKVPGAGVLTDAPGLRSLALLDEYDGLARAFPDVARLAPGCRFRDCTHGDEPGCAVRPEVDAGAIPARRLQTYRRLAAEMRANRMRLDPSASSSLTN